MSTDKSESTTGDRNEGEPGDDCWVRGKRGKFEYR